MLFSKINAAYCEHHIEHMNKPCGKNVEIFLQG